jgi:hypothetical protein
MCRHNNTLDTYIRKTTRGVSTCCAPQFCKPHEEVVYIKTSGTYIPMREAYHERRSRHVKHLHHTPSQDPFILVHADSHIHITEHIHTHSETISLSASGGHATPSTSSIYQDTFINSHIEHIHTNSETIWLSAPSGGNVTPSTSLIACIGC